MISYAYGEAEGNTPDGRHGFPGPGLGHVWPPNLGQALALPVEAALA